MVNFPICHYNVEISSCQSQENTQIIDTRSLGGQIKSNINNIEDIIFSKSRTLKRFVTQFKDAERKKAEKVTRFIPDFDNASPCFINKWCIMI